MAIVNEGWNGITSWHIGSYSFKKTCVTLNFFLLWTILHQWGWSELFIQSRKKVCFGTKGTICRKIISEIRINFSYYSYKISSGGFFRSLDNVKSLKLFLTLPLSTKRTFSRIGGMGLESFWGSLGFWKLGTRTAWQRHPSCSRKKLKNRITKIFK